MILNEDYRPIKANFNRANVLIIDDNPDQWVLIEKAMQRSLPEINLHWAKSPEQTLSLLNEWSIQEWDMPKLILLDLYLPERQDGWQLLDQIKGMSSPCRQIPVVMLSNSNNPADIAESYRRGSSSYMVKPVKNDEWLKYFQELRSYWWETVTLPPIYFSV
ncbi:response regulator [Spirosoma sp. SC4-14]|uniref:response regulator n=1 Tax=Spirosoma sp. SC4-14 TaxID=3128900 RepID=UPI0030CA7834